MLLLVLALVLALGPALVLVIATALQVVILKMFLHCFHTSAGD